MTIQEIVALIQPFIQTVPTLAKWAPAIDAVINLLESGAITQDALLAKLKAEMLTAADAEMHRELGR